jgi:hypothetical protein
MKDVLRALDHNEPVTILYRGKRRGILYPAGPPGRAAGRVSEHSAFGMWRDRADMRDVGKVIRNLRRGRADAL